jgi:hypothetical protein
MPQPLPVGPLCKRFSSVSFSFIQHIQHIFFYWPESPLALAWMSSVQASGLNVAGLNVTGLNVTHPKRSIGISFLKISSRIDDRERETSTCRWESGTCSALFLEERKRGMEIGGWEEAAKKWGGAASPHKFWERNEYLGVLSGNAAWRIRCGHDYFQRSWSKNKVSKLALLLCLVHAYTVLVYNCSYSIIVENTYDTWKYSPKNA